MKLTRLPKGFSYSLEEIISEFKVSSKKEQKNIDKHKHWIYDEYNDQKGTLILFQELLELSRGINGI